MVRSTTRLVVYHAVKKLAREKPSRQRSVTTARLRLDQCAGAELSDQIAR